MSLQNILAEIKKVKAFADEDTNSGPPETLNARRGRKAQAIESLKRLKRDYKQELMKNTVFIVSVGSQREEFAKIASEEFGVFTADSEAFYKDLASRVPEVLYKGKEGVSNIFDVLGRHLEDKMGELDILAYNQLLFKAGYAKTINSQEEFTQLIKKAINDQIGSEVAGIQAIDSIIDSAIEKNHALKFTSVALTTSDIDFAYALVKDLLRLSDKVFLAVSGESNIKQVEGVLAIQEVNKKSVEKALKEMNKSIKGR